MADTNPFDQFDTTTAAPTANPFDQFDAPKTITVTAKRGSEPGNEALGSDWENYLAGIGKSIVESGRGSAQAVMSALANAIAPTQALYGSFGAPDAVTSALGKPAAINEALKQAQSEAEQRDIPLMSTTAGRAGDISGQALQILAPGAVLKATRAAELPGVLSTVGEGGVTRALLPETVSGAAVQGGVQGAVQPLTKEQADTDRAINAAIGAGAGVTGAAIPRAIGATIRGFKGLVAPFTESGQSSIIADLARRFGIEPGNITPSQVPGVKPTLAEASGSPNAANFQRALLNQPGAQDAFAQRAAENNAARYAYLRNAAGTPESIAALQDAREAAASPLYNLARNMDSEKIAIAQGQANQIREAGRLFPGSDFIVPSAENAATAIENAVPEQVKPLMQRPAFQQAINDAAQLLAERGKPGMNPLTSVEGLQAIKTSLDNAINKAPTSSAATFDVNAVKGTRAALVQALQDISPVQREADVAFAKASAPINAQQVAQEILQRGTSATENTAGIPQVQAGKLATAMRNADDIAASVTGRKAATAAGTMTPEQIGAFKTVLGDLARQAEVTRGSLPPGSPTLQNAISQNLLSRIGAVPGLEKVTSSGPVSTLSNLFDWTLKRTGIPEKLRAKAMDFALNPTGPNAAAIRAQLTPAQSTALEQLVSPYSAQGLQTMRESMQQ